MLNNKCFLMSKELFQTLPNHMKSFFDVNGNPHWWWLRSFGYFQYRAAYVYNDGKVIHSGAPVDCDDGAVRPVLLINPNSEILFNDELDFIEFGCYNGKPVQWYVVNRRKGYLLLKNFLVDHCFRKNNHAKDADDYDASDIKKYLFEEFLPTIFTEDQIADISENRPISKFVTPAPMIRLPDHPTKEQIKQVLKWVSKFNVSPRAIYESAIREQTEKEPCEDAPSVQPKRMTGRWIGIDDFPHEDWECDRCGEVIEGEDNTERLPNFCPNCGADMRGE